MKKTAILFVLALLVTVPAFAATLAVNGTAALEGSFGLEVTTDGDTSSTFVQDDSPNNETVYRARWLMDGNDIAFGAQFDKLSVFKVLDLDSSPTTWIKVQLRRSAADAIVLNYQILTDSTWVAIGETAVPSNTKEYIVEFQQGNGDGVGRLWKAGSVKAERTDLTLTTRDADRVRFGHPSPGEATTTGSFFLDSFESFRTLAVP